jgi:AAA domain
MPAPTGVWDGSHYPYDAPPDPPEQEPPAGLQEEAEERHSWRPVDLGPILDGTWKPLEPTVGKRSDGKGLFYPGKSHTVIGETESAKTWLALSAALDEMGEGNHVLYLDLEDDEGTIVNRLLTISAHSAEMIRERFHYLRPDSDLRSRVNAADLGEVLHAYQPTLAVIDGITEAMFIHGLNPLDNVDIAHFNAILTKSLTVLGAAAVALDHVKKNGDSRDRYALGGVHKLNAVSGAGYMLENRQPFGVGLTGRSTIKIAKDRPGQLRVNGLPSGGGLQWYGDLVLESHDRDFAEVSVEPPHERDESFRPTLLMTKIAEALGSAAQPMSQRQLLALVRGKDATKRDAFALLVAEGYISGKTPHTLVKPYAEDEE